MIGAGESASGRVAGSFRDPAGYVFLREGRVFRALGEPTAALISELFRQGTLPALIDAGLVVPTRPVDDPTLAAALAAEHAGFHRFLEHEPIAPVTYPYEWTISMLADAGACTLEVQRRLLAAGCSLKDASAFNVQFAGGRPCLIDLASIERPPRLDLWYALGQFQRMFLYPLLLARRRGWELRSCFLAHLDGPDAERTSRALGRAARLRPGLLLDLTLPLLLGRRAQRRGRDGRAIFAGRGGPPEAQLANLRRLGRKIERLARGYRPRGGWAGYGAREIHGPEVEEGRRALIRRLLETHHPPQLLDLGCNTGGYSFLAAAGSRVTALDGDHDAVEMLYRRLRHAPAMITPLVADLASPSPAVGFLNRERPALLERLGGDAVLALALMHHLLVSANLSLAPLRDLLHGLTRRLLILEFVPPADPQFQGLLRFRRERFDDLTLEACRRAFAPRFALREELPVPGSPRTLLLFERQD